MNSEKLDILVFAAHPDDAELSCSGTIIKYLKAGKRVGIVDLTAGEMGTRGTAATRKIEAENANQIMGISVRENLNMPDCFFENNKENQLKIIQMIRKYQPQIVLANAITDRHPDHGRAAQLVEDAAFQSGLLKIETLENGKSQAPHRPQAVYHYIQDAYIQPDFIIDITAEIDLKKAAILAYQTQFFDPNSTEPQTYISSPDFIETVIARNREFGKIVGCVFGEGFTSKKIIGVKDIFSLC
jgi:bacillithiol biosynthesis deacetylase BshB1